MAVAALVLPTRAAPGNPPSGTVVVYADTGGDLHVKESDGTDTELGAGGGGGVSSVFGRTGAVVASSSDYDATQLDMSASSRILGRATAGAGLAEELTGAQAVAILPAASTTQAGPVELATSAEVVAGTDDVRAVTPAGAKAAYVPMSLVDAAGDLIVGTAADTVARLPVGTTGQFLTADPTAASGLKWASIAFALALASGDVWTGLDVIMGQQPQTALAISGSLSVVS